MAPQCRRILEGHLFLLCSSCTNKQGNQRTNVTIDDEDMGKEENAEAEAGVSHKNMDNMVRHCLQQFHARRGQFHYHPHNNTKTQISAVR